MKKVPSDIVLMTGDVTTLKDTARWTSKHSYHLIFIDQGIPFFPFLDNKTQITLFDKRKKPLGSVLNEALEFVLGGWLFLMSEQQENLLDHSLSLLERTVRTVPRLASLTPSSLYGLEQVPHNPLFGTIYSLWAIQNVGVFNPDLDTPESLELDWSEKMTSHGWVHMRCYIQETSVLPMERALTFGSDLMILYYGTSPEYAERLLKQGWQPSAKRFRGHHGGDSWLLYLTNVPENAAWYGDVVLGVRIPDPSRLKVDPEDGVANTVEGELDNSFGLPGNIVYDQAISPENFRQYSS